jgi:hypothetical protein
MELKIWISKNTAKINSIFRQMGQKLWQSPNHQCVWVLGAFEALVAQPNFKKASYT